jgi:RNA polymerase sigma factor (sigma-70 family)
MGMSLSQRVSELALQSRGAWNEKNAADEQLAFSLLIGVVQGAMLGRAARWVRPGDCEDVVAEALAAFLVLLRSNKAIQSPWALLLTILKHKGQDRWRADARQRATSDGALQALEQGSLQGPTDPTDEWVTSLAANELLAQLAPDERKVLYLRHTCGYSVAETSELLNLTPDQVKKRTRAALRRAKEVKDGE